MSYAEFILMNNLIYRLLELDEQRRRAEADKMAAIKALELRSQEFLMEKEEKRKLEQVWKLHM